MCPPMFHKLLYKLLTTLCVVSNCAPPPPIQKVFPTPLYSVNFLILCWICTCFGIHTVLSGLGV